MNYDINNPQSVFDFIVRALIAQGRPSIGGFQKKKLMGHEPDSATPVFKMMDDYGCMYRSQDGCKCAVGHLIPDDKYKPEMEGKTFTAIEIGLAIGLAAPDYTKSAAEDPNRKVRSLITDLQFAHDKAAFWDRPRVSDEGFLAAFLKRAREVAQNHNLDASVCG